MASKNALLRPPLGDLSSTGILVTTTTQAPIQKLEAFDSESESERILVEIPSNFVHLKSKHPGLEVDWRLKSREVFINYLSRNYVVSDFFSIHGRFRRNFYLLEKVRL